MIFPRLNTIISRTCVFLIFLIAALLHYRPLPAAIAPDRDIIIVDTPEKSENPSWKGLWDEARKSSREGKFIEAATNYKKLLSIKPNIEEAKWEYSKVLIETEEWIEASLILESLLETDPSRNDYLLKAGTVALNNKHYQQAVKYFGQIYENAPFDSLATEALKGLIAGLKGLGKKQNAFPLMEQLYIRTPSDVHLLQDLAVSAQEFGWRDKARSYYATLVAKVRVEDHILLQAALVHEQDGMEEKALPFWLKYLERQPHYLPFQKKVADYYCKTGKMSLALPHLCVLYEKGGGNDDMLLQIGRIYLQNEGRPDKALSYLERYQKKHPDDQQLQMEIRSIQTALANDLLSIVLNNGAVILWRDLAKITPNRQAIYQAMADLLEHLGNDKELFEVLEIVHVNNPNDKKIIWRLAELSFKRKNFQSANKYLKLLAGSEKDIPQYLLLNAQVEEILGHEHAALVSCLRYLDLRPDDMPTRKRSLELAGALGMVKELRTLYQGIPLSANDGNIQFSELEDIYVVGLMDNGIFSDARELLKRRGNEEKKGAGIRLRLAESYYREGLVFEAEQMVRQVLANALEVPEALKKLTAMAIKNGELVWANTWLTYLSERTGIDLVSQNYTDWPADLFFLKVELTVAQQGNEGAIDMLKTYLDQSVAKGPGVLSAVKREAEIKLCRLFLEKKNYEKCEGLLHQILDKNPEDVESQVMMEKIRAFRLAGGSKGKKDPGIDREKGKAFTHILKTAALEYEYGSYEKALFFVNDALKEVPTSVNLRILKAKIFIAESRYGEALHIFRILAQEYPDQDYFNRQVLELEFKRGNFKKIIKEIPAEPEKEVVLSSSAVGNHTTHDFIWKKLLLARSLWADGQREMALKTYESLLIMPVGVLFFQEMEAAHINLPFIPLERSFWNIITFSNPLAPDPLTTVMDPAFMGSHIGLPITAVAAGLYEKYRWQKLIGNELSARQAIKRQDYHQAEKEYKELIKKGESDETLYDLAKVYGRLELYGKEGELYEKLKKSGPEYPELDEMVRQNTLKRMPRVSLDCSYLNEEGRNGYIDIKKTTCGVEGWRMPAFDQEVDVRVDRNSFQSSETHEEVWSTRIIGTYKINISDETDTLLKFGGNFVNEDANSLLKLQLKGRIDKFISGNIGIGQEVVGDTIQAIREGIYYRDVDTGLKIDYFPRLFFGGDYRYREYSDSNYQNWYHFWTTYDLFSESSLLQLKYEYGTMQNSRANIGRDNAPGTGFLAGDLPYWSPDVYWQHLATVRYKHDIETENVFHSGKSYYTLDYSFGYEAGGEMIDSVGFNIFLEMSRHFLLEGSFKYYSAGDYNLNAGMLSVIYRW